MGYILATLAILNLLFGGISWYYKDRYEDAVKFVDKAAEKARQAEEYAKLLKIESKNNTELLNEKNQLDINHLNATINRMRQQTNSSALSNLPRNTRSPEEICFSREKLDATIQEYRDEVLTLIGKGSSCQINLNTAKDWAEQQKLLFK